jgi:hypothetical protein
MPSQKLPLKKSLFSVSTVAIVSFMLHSMLFRAFPNSLGIGFTHIIQQYLFLWVLTIAHFIVLSILLKKWPKYFGFLFTGLSLFKMLIAILFLLPWLKPLTDNSQAIALNFMFSYFIFLTVEVIILLKNMVNYHKK